jgi:hypothetical protein
MATVLIGHQHQNNNNHLLEYRSWSGRFGEKKYLDPAENRTPDHPGNSRFAILTELWLSLS